MADAANQEFLAGVRERVKANTPQPGRGAKWTSDASISHCMADREILLELVTEQNDALMSIRNRATRGGGSADMQCIRKLADAAVVKQPPSGLVAHSIREAIRALPPHERRAFQEELVRIMQ